MTEKGRIARTHYNRVAGQYRYRYGINPADYLPNKENLTATDYQRAEKNLIVAAEAEARAIKEAEAKLELSNMKEEIKSYPLHTKTVYARLDVENSSNVILSMIGEAETLYGARHVADRLRGYMAEHSNRLERLAYAIYDKEYNTNDAWYHRDEHGNLGRALYRQDMQKLATRLGVALPAMFYD